MVPCARPDHPESGRVRKTNEPGKVIDVAKKTGRQSGTANSKMSDTVLGIAWPAADKSAKVLSNEHLPYGPCTFLLIGA